MKIVAGLGNPGPKYETTRHNAGFLAVDHLIDEWKATGPEKKYEAEIYQATVRGEKVLLVKPQTYMNNSGRSIAPLAKFYKCAPEDLIVIYDDVDLSPMTIRVKTGGGTGGHNGIKSLDAHMGAGLLNYHRVRIGVGKPSKLNARMDTADYVLAQFSDEELSGLNIALKDIVTITELLVQDGNSRNAMNQFNGKKSPLDKTEEKE